jgi:hypothetical protein
MSLDRSVLCRRIEIITIVSKTILTVLIYLTTYIRWTLMALVDDDVTIMSCKSLVMTWCVLLLLTVSRS